MGYHQIFDTLTMSGQMINDLLYQYGLSGSPATNNTYVI